MFPKNLLLLCITSTSHPLFIEAPGIFPGASLFFLQLKESIITWGTIFECSASLRQTGRSAGDHAKNSTLFINTCSSEQKKGV